MIEIFRFQSLTDAVGTWCRCFVHSRKFFASLLHIKPRKCGLLIEFTWTIYLVNRGLYPTWIHQVITLQTLQCNLRVASANADCRPLFHLARTIMYTKVHWEDFEIEEIYDFISFEFYAPVFVIMTCWNFLERLLCCWSCAARNGLLQSRIVGKNAVLESLLEEFWVRLPSMFYACNELVMCSA